MSSNSAVNTAGAKLIIPAIIGNTLEWYDFSLYGYFAVIIAELFFPSQSKFLSLLETFGVYAIGFVLMIAAGYSYTPANHCDFWAGLINIYEVGDHYPNLS